MKPGDRVIRISPGAIVPDRVEGSLHTWCDRPCLPPTHQDKVRLAGSEKLVIVNPENVLSEDEVDSRKLRSSSRVTQR